MLSLYVVWTREPSFFIDVQSTRVVCLRPAVVVVRAWIDPRDLVRLDLRARRRGRGEDHRHAPLRRPRASRPPCASCAFSPSRCPPKSRLDYTPLVGSARRCVGCSQNGWIVTMDDAGTEHESGWVLVDGSVVSAVGDGAPPEADEVVDLAGAVVTPGPRQHASPPLPDAHAGAGAGRRPLHVAARAVPARGRGSTTRPSTRRRAPGWPSSRCRAARPSSTTTTSFRAGRAGSWRPRCRRRRELGVRIVASRGSMDLGESDGGLPPDSVVEEADAVLAATEELAGAAARARRRARWCRSRSRLARRSPSPSS